MRSEAHVDERAHCGKVYQALRHASAASGCRLERDQNGFTSSSI